MTTTTRTRPGQRDKEEQKRRTLRERLRAKARDLKQQIAHGGHYQCLGCNRNFRNRLQFDAHSHRHERQQDRAQARAARARAKAEERDRAKAEGRKPRRLPSPASKPTKSRAEEHAHDTQKAARHMDEDGNRTERGKARGEPLRGVVPARDLRDRARFDNSANRHDQRERRSANRAARQGRPRHRTA